MRRDTLGGFQHGIRVLFLFQPISYTRVNGNIANSSAISHFG